MKNQNYHKGESLEKAYKRLQELIIKNNPKLSDSSFEFKNNVVEVIDEVKYEVDVYITLNKNTDYESVFIAECKNWDCKKIDPKEINHFIDKIDAFGATKGIFLGTEFTKSAIARANKERRIELLKVKNKFPFPSITLGFTLEIREWREYPKIIFLEKGEEIENFKATKEDTLEGYPYINFNGKRQKLNEYLNLVGNMHFSSFSRKHNVLLLKSGINEITYKFTIKTDLLRVELDKKYERLYVEMKLFILKPQEVFKSKFLIEKNGYIESHSYEIPGTSSILEVTSSLADKNFDIENIHASLNSEPKKRDKPKKMDEKGLNDALKDIIQELNLSRKNGELEPYWFKVENTVKKIPLIHRGLF